MKAHWVKGLTWWLCTAPAALLWAGGSGLNTVVIVNRNSADSVQLGNYYCEQRQVPPQNYLRIDWTGGNTDWTLDDFTARLYLPLLDFLATRQLTNQIDYIVLSMDIPYRVTSASSASINSTTSTLFYGFKPDPDQPCSIAPGSTNRYAGTEAVFRATPPIAPGSNAFLVTMITSSNFALAKQIVDSGARSDATFPTQRVYLAKSGDAARNVRYLLFDDAIFNARLRGNLSIERIDRHGVDGLGTIFGAQTGAYSYPVRDVSFVPGGLADNLTSYGGLLFQYNASQLNMLSLLATGAAGTYGTVYEPCNYLEKFPSPQIYFYQARGFNLAECYYMGVTNPYEGLLLGDPLAAPFARPADGDWVGLPPSARLSGTTNLSLELITRDPARPIQQLDLFLDGVWLQTLTNAGPQPENVLQVSINGYTTNYLVPPDASLRSIVSNLTARLNSTSFSNATKVAASAHGDRIELRSLDPAKTGSELLLEAGYSPGSAPAATVFLTSDRTNFLDSIAFGRLNLVVNRGATYPPPTGAWLLLTLTKTNGTVVSVGSTNNSTTLTNIALLVSNLVREVNFHPQLDSPDGCVAEDFVDYSVWEPNNHSAEFNLRARSSGWAAAHLEASLKGSEPAYFAITPGETRPLEDNVSDLQPRAHLYTSAGLTNFPFSFAWDTTSHPDGFHELTVVGYEGTHVRTQRQLTRTIQIQNGPLSAGLDLLYGGSNTAVTATLQWSVNANTGDISRIELFSAGGSLGIVSNQAVAVFSIPGSVLGPGLHPFYALVTGASGQQYRTDTRWIRLLDAEPSFSVTLSVPSQTLTWPATAGRAYDILSTTNLAGGFLLDGTLIPSNSAAQWMDTHPVVSPRFFRVRTTN